MKDLEQWSIQGTVDVTGSFRRHDSFIVAAQYCIGATGKRCRFGGVVAHW